MSAGDDNPTMSGLERGEKCPASSVIRPRVFRTTDVSEVGTIKHAFVRALLAGVPQADVLAKIPKRLHKDCTAIELHRITGDLREVRGEVAHRVHVGRYDARELGVNLGRKYPRDRDALEIDGAIDVTGYSLLTGRPVVRDVKTGAYVGPAKESLQLGAHALARSVIDKADEVEGGISYVRHDGTVWTETHDFTRFDLDGVHDRMGGILRSKAAAAKQLAETGTVDVHAGPWCKYCPAAISCPDKVAFARELLPATSLIKEKLHVMTSAEQAAAYATYKQVRAMVESLGESFAILARAHPIDAGGGKAYRPTPRTNTHFDKERAQQMLAALGATEDDIRSLTVKEAGEQVSEVKARAGDLDPFVTDEQAA